jgi:hypothetical protein
MKRCGEGSVGDLGVRENREDVSARHFGFARTGESSHDTHSEIL